VTALARSGSPRLVAYATLTVLGLFGAVLSGRAELAAVAAPFALLLLAGVVLAETPAVTAHLALDTDRVIEGDTVTGSVTVTTVPPAGLVEVLVPARGALTVEHPDHGGLAWSGTSAALGVPLELRLRPTTWGLVTIGPVWVRVHGPFGLVRWEGAVGPTTTLRVLPGPASTRVLLQAAEPRAIAGSHLARIRGDGLEFAEVRPYALGDRLRAVNWSVSARRDGIWVNQRHPERSADLVVLVDTFADDRDGNAAALAPAVRAAWVLATAHLSAHDRVGLVTFGGYPAWIAPGSGERALLAFCDRLLATRAAWTEAQRSVRYLPAVAIPSGALVVGLTPLHDSRMVVALADLRRRGLEVAAVEIDVGAELAAMTAAGPVPDAALGLWRLELERRRRALAAVGIPIVPWPAGDEPAMVIERLARARRQRAGVR
jgi:uncharacterized protein (DUF58 family)